MNIQEFTKLVREMRRAQLDYYRDRTYGKLMAAKNLERQVDSALRAGVDVASSNAVPTPKPTQLNFVADQRSNDDKQKTITEVTNDNDEQPRSTNL